MFTIKYVSQRTGLTTHAIRVWERRYGVVKPIRTDTNRRLYSEEDVKKLELLKQATLTGQPIGQLVDMSPAELENLVRDSLPTAHPRPQTPQIAYGESTDHFVATALDAAKAFDLKNLETILDEAAVNFSQPELIDKIIIPFLHQVGEEWFNGEMRVAQEHGASEVIRRFIGRLINGSHVAENAPLLITATVAGLFHEFGAMLAAVAAASQGWRADYLGTNLPAEEIIFAVRRKNARAVAISIVYPPDDLAVTEQLLRLSALLPKNVQLLFSGWSAKSYEESLAGSGALFLPDMAALRAHLLRLR